MAATVLAALKNAHSTDTLIGQYITQGIYLASAPDNIDISTGGLVVINHKGTTREKSTESILETTRVELVYFYNELETLDQIVVPWAIAAFEDDEANDRQVLSIDGQFLISADVAEDEPIVMGVESMRDKNGQTVFSAVVPLVVVTSRNRGDYADTN